MSEEELPEGWAEAALEELTTAIQYGYTASADRAAAGPRFLRITDIQDGTVDWSAVPGCEVNKADHEKFSLARGDIVFARTGATTGKSFLIRECPAAVFASYLIRVRPSAAANSQFLSLCFQTPAYWSFITDNLAGNAQPNCNASKLAALPVPLPPLAEQRRIVEKVEALLAEVNAARARLAKVPAILKRFRQSILSAACSGHLSEGWAPDAVSNAATGEDEIPEGWQWRELETLALPESSAICAGPFGTIFKAHDFRDEGVSIIFLRHVAAGEYKTTKPGFMDRKKWETMFRPYSVWGGELLVAKLGDPPGCCAIYPENIGPAMVTPDVIKMSVDERSACPQYLMHYLNSEPARQRAFGVAYGATRPRMNLDIFRALRVPLPPLAEQHEIVRRVDDLFKLADAIAARVAAATARADKLTQAILAKAFRGELCPTEAELARQEGRDYEPASALLARIRAEREAQASAPKPRAPRAGSRSGGQPAPRSGKRTQPEHGKRGR